MSLGLAKRKKLCKFCLVCMDYKPGAHTHTQADLDTTVPVMAHGRRILSYTGEPEWVASQVAKTLRHTMQALAQVFYMDGERPEPVKMAHLVQTEETELVS